MRADHVFRVVDSHAGGAPSRLVLSGVPRLPGTAVMAKMQHFAAHHDWIRRSLVLEPRGQNLTSAVVLVPPSRPEADVAAFFMEAHGYLPMCGSDVISTVTVLVETGQIPMAGPDTPVTLETPAGLVRATAHVEGGRVTGVTFVGAPAFCAVPGGKLDVAGVGIVDVDIAYGGNFYAIVDAAELGVETGVERAPGSLAHAVQVAHRVREAANATFDVLHPDLPEVRGVSHVQFFAPPATGSGPTDVMVVMPTGNVDRSPCGTGTTAKVATLFGRGQLALHEPFVHRSPTGATFTGRAVAIATVGGLPACRVAITGSAFITADACVYVDRHDVLAEGVELESKGV